MNLDCIGQILINAGLAAGFGQDIFELHMPSAVSEGLLLRLPMEGIPISQYIPGFFKGRFQVIVRSKSMDVGDTKSRAICRALNMREVSFFDINAMPLLRILQCYPTTLPISYPRTDANVFEWSCNFMSQYIMPAITVIQNTGNVVPNVNGGNIQPNALIAALLSMPTDQLAPLAAAIGGATMTAQQIATAIEAMSSTDRNALMQSLAASLLVSTDGSQPVGAGQAYVNPSSFVVVAK